METGDWKTELSALKKIVKIFKTLDSGQRERILRYLWDRFVKEVQ